MKVGFIAVEKFDSSHGEAWTRFIEWSKLENLCEVVSLDHLLCPNVINEFNDDDYEHILQDNHHYNLFDNLQWLIDRTRDFIDKQILAVKYEPESKCECDFIGEGFIFIGYDLIEDLSGISALVNCGGLDKAFTKSDINKFGLINEYDKARKIQKVLDEEYPEASHADCDLWAIWRRSDD